jgi:excisionase family DNA binding protein
MRKAKKLIPTPDSKSMQELQKADTSITAIGSAEGHYQRYSEKKAHTIEETLSILPIGKTLLYELIAEGRLRAVKLKSKTLIRSTDLDAFLESLPPMGGNQ